MSQERKSKVFETLATNLEAYAWVTANVLKDKFGTIDDEEEYKKIEQEVVDYSLSDEFKQLCKERELDLLSTIIVTAIDEKKVLENDNLSQTH